MSTLSRRLAPSAKKVLLHSPRHATVASLVQVAPSIDPEAFRLKVEQAGGSIRSWLAGASVVSVEIEAGRLSELADLPGVVYVETGQPYRP
jgi:hypothetical protein